jgi:hypothetical protein
MMGLGMNADSHITRSAERETTAIPFFSTTRGSIFGVYSTAVGPKFISPVGYATTYLVLVAISYGTPAMTAMLMHKVLFLPCATTKVPYFLDVNAATMALISIPMLWISAMREDRILARTLARLFGDNALTVPSNGLQSLADRFTDRVRHFNRWAQVAGLIVGIACASIWYTVVPSAKGVVWQTLGTTRLGLNLAGWMFVVLQIVPFFFLLTQFAARECLVAFLLRRLTEEATINVRPLHPDHAGGLAPVASLGLHYQLIVAVIGIHVGTFLICLHLVDEPLSAVIRLPILAAYVVLAPIAFAVPLWPFRHAMMKAKTSSLSKLSSAFDLAFNNTLSQIPDGDRLEANTERLLQIRRLYDIVAKLPVWPFDTSSLRKFAGVFLTPLPPVAFSWLWVELCKLCSGP